MISGKLGHLLDGPLASLVRKLDINPNYLTLFGFLLSAIAGFALSRDPVTGAVIVVFAGVFDLLDGVIARCNARVSKFGAFLDSTLDRFSDAFIFLGLAYFLRANSIAVYLCMASLVGAFGVSYIRARAEGLGVECHVGIMERAERIVLILLACFTGWFLPILWALMILTYVTVFQRLLHVMNALHETR